METVLNLVWTSVSLSLLLVCGVHVLRGGKERRRAVAAVALLCLVCLLFPVISATDDVNAAGPALVETNKFKQLLRSAPVVLALLQWPPLTIHEPQILWTVVDQPVSSARTLADAFSFKLNRRPPPFAPVAA